jgi:hypothetical protein
MIPLAPLQIALTVLALAAGIIPRQTPAPSSQAVIPTVDYCELIRNPSEYDHKVIRVRATYARSGSQDSKLYDFGCDYYGSTWVEFGPAYESRTDRKFVRALSRMERDSRPRFKRGHGSVVLISYLRADVTFIGKFEAKLPDMVGEQRELPDRSSPSNLLSTVKTDYAHYNNYKHLFTVERVERVKSISPRAPW